MTDDPKRTDGERAKGELFEALEHFTRAANILFDHAAHDPKIKRASEEASRVVTKLGEAAEPVLDKIAESPALDRATAAATPVATRVASELGKLTRSLLEAVEGKHTAKPASEPPSGTPTQASAEPAKSEATPAADVKKT